MKKVSLKIIIKGNGLSSFGADKERPEFRITELKALLRITFRNNYKFWVRKDVRNKKDIKAMRDFEDFLFGSTENKAPVSLKMDPNFLEGIKVDSKRKIINSDSEIKVWMIERVKKERYGIDFIKFYTALLYKASAERGTIGGKIKEGYGLFQIFLCEDVLQISAESNAYSKGKSDSGEKGLKKGSCILAINSIIDQTFQTVRSLKNGET